MNYVRGPPCYDFNPSVSDFTGSFDDDAALVVEINFCRCHLVLQTPRHREPKYFQSLSRSKGNYECYVTIASQINAFREGISVSPQVVFTSSHTASSYFLHFVMTSVKNNLLRPPLLADLTWDIGNSKKNGNPETRIFVPKFHFSQNTGIWLK